jgi:hypothetical protein
MTNQWTYKVLELKAKGLRTLLGPEELQEALNQQGLQGWELVSATQLATNRVTLYLKKPK